MAAGVASGTSYLEHDLRLALLAGGTPDDEAAARLLSLRGADRVALEQAARRTAGNPETGRALGLLGRVAVLRALLEPRRARLRRGSRPEVAMAVPIGLVPDCPR